MHSIADSPPASSAPEAVDEHLSVVTRIRSIGSSTSVKVKGGFDEAATARLTDTAAAANARLTDTATAANARFTEVTATASMRVATTFILGGLGGLAI